MIQVFNKLEKMFNFFLTPMVLASGNENSRIGLWSSLAISEFSPEKTPTRFVNVRVKNL